MNAPATRPGDVRVDDDQDAPVELDLVGIDEARDLLQQLEEALRCSRFIALLRPAWRSTPWARVLRCGLRTWILFMRSEAREAARLALAGRRRRAPGSGTPRRRPAGVPCGCGGSRTCTCPPSWSAGRGSARRTGRPGCSSGSRCSTLVDQHDAVLRRERRADRAHLHAGRVARSGCRAWARRTSAARPGPSGIGPGSRRCRRWCCPRPPRRPSVIT